MPIQLPHLRAATRAAQAAHHDYEQRELAGEYDPHWARWYAKHIGGHLGLFVLKSQWLANVPEAEGYDWADLAADAIWAGINGKKLATPEWDGCRPAPVWEISTGRVLGQLMPRATIEALRAGDIAAHSIPEKDTRECEQRNWGPVYRNEIND